MGTHLHLKVFLLLTTLRFNFFNFKIILSGCIRIEDSENNFTEIMPIKNPPDEIQIELTVLHKYCILMVSFNDTTQCTHSLIMNSDSFLDDFKDSLCYALKVNPERIYNLTNISQDSITDKVIIDSHRVLRF